MTIFFTGVYCTEEFRLIRYLLDENRYHPNVRPAAQVNETVEVRIGMALNQIIDLVRISIQELR